MGLDTGQGLFLCLSCSSLPTVRDRLRTKIERDILADVNHPFVVKLHYGEWSSLECWESEKHGFKEYHRRGAAAPADSGCL